MTPEELARREERAAKETFVIARTEEGFRIHAPANGGHVYHVTGSPEAPECTCPDFQRHAADPDWRCKHILAVLRRHGPPEEAEGATAGPPAPTPAPEASASRLTLKRSVSPDGRIDALSVQVSIPMGHDPEEAENRAREVLALQDRITKRFLRGNSRARTNGAPSRPPQQTTHSNDPEPATILEVGGMEGRWGRRLFLTFQVNGRRLRLYGSEKKLAQAIRYAGYPEMAEDLEEGMRLQLPCRVETQPTEDGKYVNVVRVYPDEERSGARW